MYKRCQQTEKKDKAGIRTRNSETTARRVTITLPCLCFFKDTLGRTRTGDPWIKSPMLYLLSYEGSRCQFKPPSGSRTDSSEPSGDPPHVCCTPNGNLCGWVGCVGCSLVGLALDGVGLGDACGAGFGQGGVQLVQNVLAQHMVIELRGSLAVEREPPHFADGLAGPGLVAVILGPRRAELHDAVAVPQLIFEFAQVLAQGRTGLTGTVRQHHRVRVEVQDLFPQVVE